MMPSFTPNRSILNPQFEGYKLSFTPSPHLNHIPLPHHATQSRADTRVLAFEEVASRVRHNHLAVGEDSAIYVGERGVVVLMQVEDEDGDADQRNVNKAQEGLSLRVVFHLPEHVSTSTPAQAEYPGAAYVTRDIWLVSDGYGRAYLIRTPVNATDRTLAHLISSWEFMVGDPAVLIPFQLHYGTPITHNLGLAILSWPTTFADTSSTTKASQTFDICAVRIPLPDLSPSSFDQLSSPEMVATPIPFEVAWCRRSSHIPLFTTYCPARDAFLFLGGSPYYDVASQRLSQPYKPAPDELAPVPRAGECLDNNRSDLSPYSWTQNDETLTIAFALPGTTLTTSIHATFETGTLSLRIGPPALPQPLYAAAPLWDSIHPASSLWTWERGNADTAGLLTMHLDKAHPGTRWSHVFAAGFESRETPETLDPSELAGIRESLDKFTVSLQHSASALGHGVPSLAEGERDNEVDASIGNPVVLTWVGSAGSTSCATDDGSAAVLLSLPLPGAKGSFPLSLVVKNDIDGLLYTLDEGGWTHLATYPALAFVLASKRDTRFTFHVHSAMALAFESGACNDGSGNVYLYYGSAPNDKWAKQSVLQQPGAGALLGVGNITSKTGRTVLLCLSERELTVCHGLVNACG